MRFASLVLVLALLSIAGGAVPLFAQEEGDAPTQDFTTAIRAADHVVTARILGVVDPGSESPIPPARKVREAHWAQVRSTLKGHDITARRILVRPNTLEWQDGATYVLFLKDLGRDRFDAIPQPVRHASPADIAAAVRKLGYGVQPSLKLRVRLWGGCCSVHHGVVKELRVTGDGGFTFEELVTDAAGHPQGQKDVRVGVLPADALAAFLTRVESVKPVPMPDGGGVLDIEFFGDAEEARHFAFTMIDQPEAPDLLSALAEQARLSAPTSTRVAVVEVP